MLPMDGLTQMDTLGQLDDLKIYFIPLEEEM
jgi:hypothetical protein